MKNRMVLSTLSLLALLLGSACGSGPPAKMYLLEPVLAPELVEPMAKVTDLGITVVSLPGYASDPRIASRSQERLIVQAERHRWAEDPEEAITRVLADRLRYITKANVVTEPWPRGYEPQARVEVSFDRLLRESSGGVEMAGQIKIIAGDGRSVKAIRTFQVIHYAESTEFRAYFSAVAAGINDIVRIATAAMRSSIK
ncbi:MAG: PqiC family protein [Granulosicoccaceae bacterium]